MKKIMEGQRKSEIKTEKIKLKRNKKEKDKKIKKKKRFVRFCLGNGWRQQMKGSIKNRYNEQEKVETRKKND